MWSNKRREINMGIREETAMDYQELKDKLWRLSSSHPLIAPFYGDFKTPLEFADAMRGMLSELGVIAPKNLSDLESYFGSEEFLLAHQSAVEKALASQKA
jgi:hypothetical protein